jgi:Leucine-rich repeat (LRR) protein
MAAIGLLAASLAHASIPPGERAVLDNLYTSTNGNGWTVNTGWEGEPGSECTWYGIDCDVVDGSEHVVSIDLIQNRLSGSLPELTGLTRLRHFYAPINLLTGTIPPLDSLTDLRTFEVFANLLDGSLPLLTGLSQLVSFDVSINQLHGGVPQLTGLDQLVTFDVSDNRLRGAVPALTGLTQLHFFQIGGNRLTGAVPDPPVPNNLAPGGSRLCVSLGPDANALAPTQSLAWNFATGTTPWYLACDTETIFADGADD